MKRPKDRLHRVMVLGANPAGIIATNKLGEMGIPVTLVDTDANLDAKLSQEQWQLPNGVKFNHAHRPGLIRILRNPQIECILPARVRAIKHNLQGFSVALTKEQTFIDPQRCILCGRCVDTCPVYVQDNGNSMAKAIQFDGRASLPGSPRIDKRRMPLCRDNCPLGVNVQGYVALAKEQKFAQALDLIRQHNVLPGICGRICTHPCEAECRRQQLDDPVSIRAIKRFLSDWGAAHPDQVMAPAPVKKRDETFAVIGSGPAGIAAAAQLARHGCRVDVYEKEAMAGGLLRYGIGVHRLPRNILDAELAYIEGLGVHFHLNHPVDLTSELTPLTTKYNGVIVTTGTWKDRPLGVDGEDLDGVQGCLEFLNRFYRGQSLNIGKKVAVIGDGNSAFDLARTLCRMGSEVTIVSWFDHQAIPADPEEVHGAVEEGVSIVDNTRVVAFEGDNGRLQRLVCRPTQPGPPDAKGIKWPVVIENSEPFYLNFDNAFVAIGQVGGLSPKDQGIRINPMGYIETNGDFRTNIPGVFAAGDAVTGPSTVVHAMARGKAAADCVLEQICHIRPHTPGTRRTAREFPEIPETIPRLNRIAEPEVQPSRRKNSFSEVTMGLSESQVIQEASRCLQCGVCSECLQCVEVCHPIQAIDHNQQEEDLVAQAGVVIIADADMAPPVRGEDVIRAYGPKTARSGVHEMMTRGMAAAAQAMVLLSGQSTIQKGHGISVLATDAGLSPQVRVGVFVCKCNESLGWLEAMDQYLRLLTDQPDIVHVEAINAACTPDGISTIISKVLDKGITRMVLGACVCCPLDFVCSACTDQRSRLKHGLFTATGISRSMVVTNNIRGEALSLVKRDPDQALKRFRGLISRSVSSSRKLNEFSSPVRHYNFAAAVIGNSEAAVEAVQTLAGTGMDVYWFPGMAGQKSSQSEPVILSDLVQPNVHVFPDTQIHFINGTLGDFQLKVRTGNFDQMIRVGAVIIGDKIRKKSIDYYFQHGNQSRVPIFAMQEADGVGIPFLLPGMTSVSGLFMANSPQIRISEKQKGQAAAVLAAAAMPRGPRKNKGYTVSIDKKICRGCGRCAAVCPYQAVSFSENGLGGWYASVDELFCKGCGNCISVCPSNAADSPYRDQRFFQKTLEQILL